MVASMLDMFFKMCAVAVVSLVVFFLSVAMMRRDEGDGIFWLSVPRMADGHPLTFLAFTILTASTTGAMVALGLCAVGVLSEVL